MSIRVFFVDDQSLVRAGFVMVVEAQEDMCVVGEASNGQDALDQLAARAADVVLMDARMPRMDGVEATRRLFDRPGPSPKVIMLTTYDLDEYMYGALRAGASGFVVKDVDPEDLLAAIRTVHDGDAVVAPSATRRLIDRVAADLPTDGPSEAEDLLTTLTDREREVVLQLARGRSNAEIATDLFLSEGTVKTHVGRILGKLGLRDRVQAVIFAYEHRLIRPSS